MKLLKAIFQNALLLATLATIVAGAILVAYADHEAVDGRRAQRLARQADEGVPPHLAIPASAARPGDHADATGWMKVPRGSLVDAAL